ncbi:hypothetical protein GALMADRAFT_236374 [Galerina marginata CBS 339.88]|uniref:Uncharacterized protein n=1 Tax=Galerina marginata (strain CBS 339.88) TaxID=685588 RepID=A0A067TNJ6_GALM3|nr:hypothetical protein GALMADRAFT_236374 [Galerina marginata CBS 339.88]
MSDSSPPSYSFHGSNSSHSKDNGSGGRTYHIPNYATSYANDRSKLISIRFDEDKGTSRVILAVLSIFLLFAAAPLSVILLRCPQAVRSSTVPSAGSSQPTILSEWSQNPQSNAKAWTQATSTEELLPDVQAEPIQRTHEFHPESHKIQSGYWDEPLPGAHCLGFGTREYTARLWNLPFFSDWVAACKETEIEIRGALIPRPSYCESRWPMGGVIGHWIANFEEDQCLAYWGNFSDKGCVRKGSKIRRFQSRLWGVKSREDWMTICRTAPAVVHGIQIPNPSFCDDRGIWGIYGIWDIDDQNC